MYIGNFKKDDAGIIGENFLGSVTGFHSNDKDVKLMAEVNIKTDGTIHVRAQEVPEELESVSSKHSL